jgi:hypothetical protein
MHNDYKQTNNSFYETYNEDGYTYSQWYVYFISKNYYRYKDLKKQTYWFFQIMAGYGFFKKMVRMGKRDDPLHTTLHHFLKYLDNFTWYTNKIIDLLHDNGLQLEDEDGEGISGNDYLAQHLLSPEDLEHSKRRCFSLGCECDILPCRCSWSLHERRYSVSRGARPQCVSLEQTHLQRTLPQATCND